MLGKNKVSKERFDIFGGSVNTFAQVVIICSNQSVTKIPRVIGKRFIADVEAKRAQVFDCKHCRCTGISLTESVNLPNSGNKLSDVCDSIIDVQILIAKILFLHEIEIKRFTYTVGTGIKYSFAFQHPLPFGDIVIPDLSCKFIDALEQAAMNGDILNGRKCKRLLR